MKLEDVTASGLPPIIAVDVSVSAEEAVRTASVDCVIIGSGLPVSIGQPVTLAASGEVILTGYVRDMGTGYDDQTRTLNIGLVSKTVDLVECSAEHKTGEWMDKDLSEIANDLDTLGVGIETDGSTFEKEPRHKLITGESAFQSIERRARGRGVLIYDTPKGRLKLATKPEGTHAGTLRRGVNILKGATANFTERGRYSEIKVRGQSTGASDKASLRPEVTAKDSGITRRRPLIIAHEGEITPDRMKKRSQWQANRAAGQSVTASLPVTGWRDEAGQLWQRNWLVQVEDDWLGLSGLMIIKGVSFQQGNEGTKAVLSLADPRALGGENPRGKSAAGYGAPGAVEAEYQDE
jgi:prophage tail gpP-like protein